MTRDILKSDQRVANGYGIIDAQSSPALDWPSGISKRRSVEREKLHFLLSNALHSPLQIRTVRHPIYVLT